jgi:hypothetical protein
VKLGNEVRERINGKTDGTTGSPSDDNLLKDDKNGEDADEVQPLFDNGADEPKEDVGIKNLFDAGVDHQTHDNDAVPALPAILVGHFIRGLAAAAIVFLATAASGSSTPSFTAATSSVMDNDAAAEGRM